MADTVQACKAAEEWGNVEKYQDDKYKSWKRKVIIENTSENWFELWLNEGIMSLAHKAAGK